MPKVVALYRYPVKGFSAEAVDNITVLPGGRVAGDRVLNFRFADAPVADSAWCRKYHGVVLANTPGLARLQVRWDAHAERVIISQQNQILAEEPLTQAGCGRLTDVMTALVAALSRHPLHDQPDRLPLRLVGDGKTPRYQDNEGGQVTLHSRDSVREVGAALGESNLDEQRFRHNIAIDGVAAWTEQSWVGSRLSVGEVAFETIVPKVRCLATHANPLTGEFDLPVMQTLCKAFAQKEPTFGIGMLSQQGGVIRLGDTVAVIP